MVATKFEIEILIPVRDNQGRKFTKAHDRRFEVVVGRSFGGWTWTPPDLAGGWLHDGRVYRDRNRSVRIALAGLMDAPRLESLLRFARRHYRQKALYLRYLGLTEEFAG